MMYEIMLGVPGSGTLSEASAKASWKPSLRHKVHREPSNWTGPNFNLLWMKALNNARLGKITHFAMMHTDITVVEDEQGSLWLDRLVEEMDVVGADFLSTPIAIKDGRSLTSSGIGNPKNRWNPWRRFSIEEVERVLPRIFNADSIGYGDKFLLHNNGLCLWDMRKDLWQIPFEDGRCRFVFNLTEQIRLDKEQDQWVRDFDSEDWAFSRQLWEGGARTFISTRIKVEHHGAISYRNKGDAIEYASDEDTQAQWRPDDPFVMLAKNGRYEAARVSRMDSLIEKAREEALANGHCEEN